MKVAGFVLLLGLLGESAQAQAVRNSIFRLDPNGPEIASLRHGIQVMVSRSPSDPTSWVYQANIHGTYDQPAQPLWNQCQHASYFFFSWHRMYLYYFERILRKASGDPNLTLPYWNYTNDVHEPDPDRRQLPLPFRQPAVQCALPPSPPTPGCNSLFVSERAGPINDGSGYLPLSDVDTSAAFAYTNFDAPEGSGSASFGGPIRSHHGTDGDAGALEVTPHDVVHGDIGGWMGDPNLAARDPIFFLHHANVDRLWKRWLDKGGGRQDPTDGKPGDQMWMTTRFIFFDENGNQVQKTGKDIIDTVSQLGYCYDDDPVCSGAPPPAPTNCSVTVVVCGHEATLVCDPVPIPNTLVLEARRNHTLQPPPPFQGAGFTLSTPTNGANIVYDAPIDPLDNEFEACDVNPSNNQRSCVWPVPFVGPDLTGCPGHTGGPGVPPGQCVKEGCVPRRGGGCICE